jgi:hypothetical protein
MRTTYNADACVYVHLASSTGILSAVSGGWHGFAGRPCNAVFRLYVASRRILYALCLFARSRIRSIGNSIRSCCFLCLRSELVQQSILTPFYATVKAMADSPLHCAALLRAVEYTDRQQSPLRLHDELHCAYRCTALPMRPQGGRCELSTVCR